MTRTFLSAPMWALAFLLMDPIDLIWVTLKK